RVAGRRRGSSRKRMVASCIQMAGQLQVPPQHVEEALGGPGAVEAERMGGRPPQEPQPPDAERQAQHPGDGAHDAGVVARQPGPPHRLGQRLRHGELPTAGPPLHQPISTPPAKPKKSRKKVDAAKAMERPKRMPRPRRMDDPPSLMATPAPNSTTAITAAA